MTDHRQRDQALMEVCDWLNEVGENQLCSRMRERWEWYQLYGRPDDEIEELVPDDE